MAMLVISSVTSDGVTSKKCPGCHMCVRFEKLRISCLARALPIILTVFSPDHGFAPTSDSRRLMVSERQSIDARQILLARQNCIQIPLHAFHLSTWEDSSLLAILSENLGRPVLPSNHSISGTLCPNFAHLQGNGICTKPWDSATRCISSSSARVMKSAIILRKLLKEKAGDSISYKMNHCGIASMIRRDMPPRASPRNNQ